MQFITAVILSAATALVSAQTIDPSSVPDATRAAWCLAQQSQCPLLCTQINDGSAAVIENDCNSDNLAYSCVCGNNVSPNATEYSQTIPYFECTENNNRCVNNCGIGSTACAAACRDNNPCGASDPTRYNVTATATLSTATSTAAIATAVLASSVPGQKPTGGLALPKSINGNNGNGDSQLSSTDSNPNNISGAVSLAIDLGRVYGTVGVLGSVLVGIFML